FREGVGGGVGGVGGGAVGGPGGPGGGEKSRWWPAAGGACRRRRILGPGSGCGSRRHRGVGGALPACRTLAHRRAALRRGSRRTVSALPCRSVPVGPILPSRPAERGARGRRTCLRRG